MTYIALLRGVNVGGNNKVSMNELKQLFESLGFERVSTYINSGNIIFDTRRQDNGKLIEMCEEAMLERFGFRVVCCVLSAIELKAIVNNAPSWWDKDSTDKNNLMFIIPPETPDSIISKVGEPKKDYELIKAFGSVIFWTAPLGTFGRTRYSKIVGTESYKYITIRNANTVRKLAEIGASYLPE